MPVTDPVLTRRPVHALDGRLAHVEVAIETSLQRLVEPLRGQIHEARHMELEGGVVDEHIPPAKCLDGPRHRVPAGLAVPHIGCDRQAATAFGLNGLDRGAGGGILAEIGDDDIRPFPCKEHRDRAADT